MQDNPANTIDTNLKHRHIDRHGNEYYRHLDGTIYCNGSRVLRKTDDSTFEAMSGSLCIIATATVMYEKWS